MFLEINNAESSTTHVVLKKNRLFNDRKSKHSTVYIDSLLDVLLIVFKFFLSERFNYLPVRIFVFREKKYKMKNER